MKWMDINERSATSHYYVQNNPQQHVGQEMNFS